MRAIIVFAAFSLLGAGLSAFGDHHRQSMSAREAGHLPDIYFFGGTYRTVEAETADACAGQCGDDVRCRAWSYVPARTETQSFCELKRNGGIAEAQPRTVSGISPRHQALYANSARLSMQDIGATPIADDTGLAGGPGS